MADLWPAIVGGATGVIGSVVGAMVNEAMRRSNRIETFSAKVFDKRLAAYEGLLEQMRQGYAIAADVMEDASLSPEQRHEAIAIVVHAIGEFSDSNDLYLDDDLRAHCMATFMGAEDILAIEDETERQRQRGAITRMYNQSRRMIREDSGIAGVSRLLKGIARPRLDGDFIDYLRAERRKHRRRA